MHTAAAATIAAALVAPLGWFAVQAGEYDGPARWETTTVKITADLVPASQQWGDTLSFEVAPEGEADISTAPATTTDKGVGGEAASTYRDGNYLASCVIRVAPDTDPAVISHEFGHCLGLGHDSTTDASNMHWWAGDVQGGWSETVTDADRARLDALYS